VLRENYHTIMKNIKLFKILQFLFGASLFVLFSSTSFAQESSSQGVDYHKNLETALTGVFQVQLNNPRLKPMISTDLLEQVRDNQQQRTAVTFDYKSMRILVISKDDELNGNLIPENQFVIGKN
jgi:hypothetical protein